MKLVWGCVYTKKQNYQGRKNKAIWIFTHYNQMHTLIVKRHTWEGQLVANCRLCHVTQWQIYLFWLVLEHVRRVQSGCMSEKRRELAEKWVNLLLQMLMHA